MATIAQPTSPEVLLSELSRKMKKLSILAISLAVLLVLSVAALTFFGWRKAKFIAEAQKNLTFSQFVTDYNNSTDFVTPQVNTIQFLRRGFSIDFDSVKYTQEGLSLTGTIGNGTELYVGSLAVNFIARPYPYKIRDKWEKGASGDWIPWWYNDWNIGSGQTTVGTLNPGSSVPFSVTIPNVKQTPDGLQIAVSFSGERYWYLK